MRLIDGDDLLSAFPLDDEEPTLKRACVRMTIKHMPTIEAEPIRHGHWIEEKSIGDCCYKCSECGFIRDAYLLEIENYCPHCGAKMDGGNT